MRYYVVWQTMLVNKLKFKLVYGRMADSCIELKFSKTAIVFLRIEILSTQDRCSEGDLSKYTAYTPTVNNIK